ncbi:head GIN domain-containing protein [Parasphingorhabdus litoris]|uniref:Head GIN domain-containing protein n=1 Tax=Parasphingorhabdus litoris TaxID=394733 RepID=A0ABP3KU25_9SPHN|nr:head GIN domain-containing protein [Parasphingorhabdus litoris]
MKKLLFVIPLLALSACEGSIASAVGSAGKSSFSDGTQIGTTATNPGEFDGVTLAGPDNVVFTTGSDFSIRAEGKSDTLEQLRYKITDGQLKIGREKNGGMWSGDYNGATVYVSAPSLKSAKLAGSGDMQVDNMNGENAKISVAGSGNVDVAALETASLTTKVAGSGDVSIAGTADEVTISVAGSGDISGKKLKAENATIKVAGSGDVSLSSDGAVEATVVGSGDIRIHGDAVCKTKSRGSGDITCG